jgi:hypothetical protein
VPLSNITYTVPRVNDVRVIGVSAWPYMQKQIILALFVI